MDTRTALTYAICIALVAAAVPARADEDAADDGASEVREQRTTQMCIDQEIADRLAVKRKRRGAVDRLFVKRARHELSAIGGYFVSDLYSGTYLVGAAYSYSMTESTAVELSGAWTHNRADVARSLEDRRAEVIEDEFARVLFFESTLLWSPIYGKLRMGGAIFRFDIHLDAGVGVVDSPTSRGATGVAGMGMKLFLGKAWALRLDARDHIYRQEMLAETFLVNDLSLTAGLSLFLPLRN